MSQVKELAVFRKTVEGSAKSGKNSAADEAYFHLAHALSSLAALTTPPILPFDIQKLFRRRLEEFGGII